MARKLYYDKYGTPYYLDPPETEEEWAELERRFADGPIVVSLYRPEVPGDRSRPADPEPADKPPRQEPS